MSTDEISLDDFFEKVNKVNELFAILANEQHYDEATYHEALIEILKLLNDRSALVLLFALIESHTKLLNKLFTEGILKHKVCDCCDPDDKTKH
jgi:hypothetical protein